MTPATSYSCEELHLTAYKHLKRERTIRQNGARATKGAKINRGPDAGEKQYKSGIIIHIERFGLTLYYICENLMPL